MVTLMVMEKELLVWWKKKKGRGKNVFGVVRCGVAIGRVKMGQDNKQVKTQSNPNLFGPKWLGQNGS